MTQALDILVFGVVQGVGFRPFVYRTARRLGYAGWVKNVGLGVEIHLESPDATDFRDFLAALENETPPLSLIERTDVKPGAITGCAEFTIRKTRSGESFVFISPDISVCDSCRTEMQTPGDRRYAHPFINCTDCGPRYTIVDSLPYDRDRTTMRGFDMCPDCRREYEEPMDRRYHAQPIACPVCGPQVTLIDAATRETLPGGIPQAAALIQAGKILAVKGLGGFHLVCDPSSGLAISRLRGIKDRRTKPFALMARGLDVVERFAHVSDEEKALLDSARRPIVLLRRKRPLEGIAPHLKELGFMLPYTPLHYLLLQDLELIVATSSNRKDSPIMKDEAEGQGIYGLCDAVLTHDRPITMRADDSVIKTAAGSPLFVRRARGYVPYPQAVAEALRVDGHVLALGGELKDTVSVYKNGYVVTSQFLGDLDEYQNYRYFEETIAHLARLFEIQPRLVLTDLHPDFHTTRHARRTGLPHLQVQHHFAHVLAVLLEHGIPPGNRVLGIAWDGFGYGLDGTPWGAEFLAADYDGFERLGHFRYVPLPGGDLAAKQPWRMALAYLDDAFEGDLPELPVFDRVKPGHIRGVREMIRRKLNSPPASSCGRLFDAVSFLAGTAPVEVEYEAEAPMRLEAAAEAGAAENGSAETSTAETDSAGAYPFSFSTPEANTPYAVSFAETIRAIVDETKRMTPAGLISDRFHNTLAEVIAEAALRAREVHSLETVVLSGGVFLNKVLLEKALTRLASHRFKVLRPVSYSPNDEAISLGQIAFGLHHLREKGRSSPKS